MMHAPLFTDGGQPALTLPGTAQAEAPIMFSQRAYLRITLVISVAFGLIALPTRGLPARHSNLAGALLLCLNGSLAFQVQFWLHFLLRYRPSVVQRWFVHQSLLTDRALRAGLTALLVTCYSTSRYYLDRHLHIRLDDNSLTLIIVLAQVVAVVGLSCQLGIELIESSRSLAFENEALKREQLQARYDSLKQQLSPHFLFNSLSTLSGLIYDEPTAAEKFVDEMAQVYRYLLKHGEQQATPLREELAFVQSYVYLLQMRFGEYIDIIINLPKTVLDRQLPPLALQLLVENAVKHNAISMHQPLRITIDLVAPDQLRVCNPRYPRLSPEASTGTGLRNLANRIRLLRQQPLLVEQTDHEFCVLLPLSA